MVGYYLTSINILLAEESTHTYKDRYRQHMEQLKWLKQKEIREQALQNQAAYYSQKSYPLSSIIKLQKNFRGKCARREYQKLKKFFQQRTNIAKELLLTESTYVGALHHCVEKYMVPLIDNLHSSKPFISTSQIKSIFGNIKMLHKLNSQLHNKLQERLQLWSPSQIIGDIFLDPVSIRY